MNRKLTVGIVLILVVVGVVGYGYAQGQGQSEVPTKQAAQDEPPVTVTAKGSIVPAMQARLGFKGGGRVESVLVREGDRVTRGQALAKLDTAELELQVKAAEDALAVNEAMLSQARAGARPEEIEAAEAAYSGALAKYNQTLLGAAEAEVKAAEAALEGAKERLAQTEATVEAEEVAGKAGVESARARLAQLKDGPRAEDVKAAELQLEQAKSALWAAQVDRDGAKNIYGSASYQGKSADARVASAETAVQVAEVSLLKMKKGASAEDVKIAEAAVQQAEAQQKAKQSTAQATMASARAAVDSAEARLAQLKAGPTKADKDLAASSLAGAKATAEIKKKGASQAELEVALARVEQAKTAVVQAKAALANATLEAPFDGMVASAQIRKGEMVGPGAAAIILGDTSQFQVETNDLDEASATKIQVGQAVDVIVLAFENKVLKGKVMALASYATITPTGDANYTATIALNEQDSSLRWGMTTKVDFGVKK